MNDLNNRVTSVTGSGTSGQVRTTKTNESSDVRQDVSGSGKTAPQETQTETKAIKEVTESVSQVRDYVQSFRRDLEFSVDEDSGRTVIRVLDSETHETIRQIPAEEVLEIARVLKASAEAAAPTTGLLVHSEA